MYTRNLSVDEIGERYRLNHAIVVKLYHYSISLQRSPIAYLIGEPWLFRCIGFTPRNKNEKNFICPSVDVDRLSNHVVGKILLQGLKCYSSNSLGPTIYKSNRWSEKL